MKKLNSKIRGEGGTIRMKNITMSQYKWNIRLTFLFGILLGMFLGAILVYKILGGLA